MGKWSRRCSTRNSERFLHQMPARLSQSILCSKRNGRSTGSLTTTEYCGTTMRQVSSSSRMSLGLGRVIVTTRMRRGGGILKVKTGSMNRDSVEKKQ